MKIKLVFVCNLVVCLLFAVAPEDKERIQKFDALWNRLCNPETFSMGDAIFALNRELEAEAKILVRKAIMDINFDSEESLLSVFAKNYSLIPGVLQEIRRFIEEEKSETRKMRLINFLVSQSYKGMIERNNSTLKVSVWIDMYPDPNLFFEESKRLMKELILTKRMSVLYADVLNLSADNEIQALLKDLSKKAKYDSFPNGFSRQAWNATCMLARQGDKEALDTVRAAAKDLTDFNLMRFIPVGMGYIGTEEMALLLFEMLKSDLEKLNGNVFPEKTQLAHEAAVALFFCVEGFPEYGQWGRFTDADKAKCLDWVKANKDSFKVKKIPANVFLEKIRG